MTLTSMIIQLLQSCAPNVEIRDSHRRPAKFWWVESAAERDKGYVCISAEKPHRDAKELK